jgi:hypothetical protein
MAGQVVIPFPIGRAPRENSAHDDAWTQGNERQPRAWVGGRFRTAVGVVRAVLETLSYLSEPRIRPPLPALPPAARGRAR